MKHIILFILLLPFVYIQAQQQQNIRIGIEYGSYGLTGNIDDQWEFRRDKISTFDWYDQYGNEYVIGEGQVNFLGMKAELSVWDNRLTLASGLRYNHVKESIGTTSRSPIHLFNPSSKAIELFRIREMNESLGYIGIPLEADIVILGLQSNWHLYAKAGIQAGLKIYEEIDIDFVSDEMKKYRDEIIKTAGKTPSNIFINAYGSLGLRLILRNETRFSVEVLLPTNTITKDNFSLLIPETYGGMQLSVSLPISLLLRK